MSAPTHHGPATAAEPDRPRILMLTREVTDRAFKLLREGFSLDEVARVLNEELGGSDVVAWDAEKLEKVLLGDEWWQRGGGLQSPRGIFMAALRMELWRLDALLPVEADVEPAVDHAWQLVEPDVDDLIDAFAEEQQYSPTALVTMIVRDFFEGTNFARREFGLRPGEGAKRLIRAFLDTA